ncbi:unnamed protein product, partial [Vitis vinifera]
MKINHGGVLETGITLLILVCCISSGRLELVHMWMAP